MAINGTRLMRRAQSDRFIYTVHYNAHIPSELNSNHGFRCIITTFTRLKFDHLPRVIIFQKPVLVHYFQRYRRRQFPNPQSTLNRPHLSLGSSLHPSSLTSTRVCFSDRCGRQSMDYISGYISHPEALLIRGFRTRCHITL